jgi:hypothetical protein
MQLPTSVGMSAVLSAGTPCRLRTGAIPVVRAPGRVDERPRSGCAAVALGSADPTLAGVLRMGLLTGMLLRFASKAKLASGRCFLPPTNRNDTMTRSRRRHLLPVCSWHWGFAVSGEPGRRFRFPFMPAAESLCRTPGNAGSFCCSEHPRYQHRPHWVVTRGDPEERRIRGDRVSARNSESLSWGPACHRHFVRLGLAGSAGHRLQRCGAYRTPRPGSPPPLDGMTLVPGVFRGADSGGNLQLTGVHLPGHCSTLIAGLTSHHRPGSAVASTVQRGRLLGYPPDRRRLPNDHGSSGDRSPAPRSRVDSWPALVEAYHGHET